MARKDRWVKRWKVRSDSGNGEYTVAQDKDGKYGCSCPRWTQTFPRADCKHIGFVKATEPEPSAVALTRTKATCIPANVPTPTYDEQKNTILYPLIPLEPFDIHMEATIDLFMYEHGWSWAEIQERRHLPASWTLRAVEAHIEKYGRKTYADQPRDYVDEALQVAEGQDG